MRARSYTWFLLFSLIGCSSQGDETSTNQRERPALFKVPVLTQAVSPRPTKQSQRPEVTISSVWPSFVGRYPLAPRLAFETPEKLGEADFIQGNYLTRLEHTHTVRTDSLEVVADYSCTLRNTKQDDSVAHRAFPVYLANMTPRIKYVYGEGSRLYAIQEAKDRAGKWRPIERIGQTWCGGNQFALELRPRHLVVFLANKYEGPFSTWLRIRVLNRKTLYISQPYPGYINKQQFVASPGDERVLKNNPTAANRLYLGAVFSASSYAETR
jgi:hypothetical protein